MILRESAFDDQTRKRCGSTPSTKLSTAMRGSRRFVRCRAPCEARGLKHVGLQHFVAEACPLQQRLCSRPPVVLVQIPAEGVNLACGVVVQQNGRTIWRQSEPWADRTRHSLHWS